MVGRIGNREVDNKMPLKYLGYTDLGIVSAKKPINTHLIWETTAGGLYLVDSGDQTKIQYSADKGATWTQIDVDPSDSSGDNESRDMLIQSAWHDRANKIIWFVDCDNDGTADQFDVWKMDYSASESAPTTTEVGSESSDDNNTYYAWDIFMIGTDVFVFNHATDTGVHAFKIWEVDTAPFVEKDAVDPPSFAVGDGVGYYGAVVSNIYYGGAVDTNFDIYQPIKYNEVADTLSYGNPEATITAPDKNQRSIAYKNGFTYMVIDDEIITPIPTLWTWEVGADTITEIADHDVVLMCDRNTLSSSIMEKAFHTTEYKVYELQSTADHQLNLIAVPATGEVIIAITDNFLITTTGKMFEYEDLINKLKTVSINHQINESSHAIVTLTKGQIPIEKNMFMKFLYKYTTAGSTSEEIIFEGIIKSFTENVNQTILLTSPAKRELRTIKPSGDYTVDSDGLMNALVVAYNNYITVGTLTDGADLGTITLGGDQIEETVFDGCAQFEGWIWALTPTGKLYFNNGTTDSTINYTEASGLQNVKPDHAHEEYNKIKVKGAYVDGVQVVSAWQEDLGSQQRVGINERIFTLSFLNTTALCNTAASNVLTILARDPKRVTFMIRDTTAGYIQVGETITFECSRMGVVIASDQFLITSASINKQGEIIYTIQDEL